MLLVVKQRWLQTVATSFGVYMKIVCKKCGLSKDSEDFYNNKLSANGKESSCKECKKSIVRSRNVGRRDTRVVSETRKATMNTYRLRYPNKSFAHNLVKAAIRNGTIRPQPCEVCFTNVNARAHHDDYNKPLEVRWLCDLHHKEWHRKHGEGLNGK